MMLYNILVGKKVGSQPFLQTCSNFESPKHLPTFKTFTVINIRHISFCSIRSYFCDADDPNKRIGFLCPDYTGFLTVMETYFMASLTSVLEGNVDGRSVSVHIFVTIWK